MSRIHAQELGFVADAITTAHELQDLLDQQERWTAAMRVEVQQKVAKLTGLLHVADFALTGDPVGVMNTMEDIHSDALYGLAA